MMTSKQLTTWEVSKMLAAMLPTPLVAQFLNHLIGAEGLALLTDRQVWVAESLLNNLIELAPEAAAEAANM